MILSQPDLRKAVKKGRIAFDPPLEEGQWGETSVNLRLGHQFTKFKTIPGVTVSVANGLQDLENIAIYETEELELNPKSGQIRHWVLGPGEFVLVLTYEKVTVPNDLVALVEGRSTYARVGLSMHLTAPWIQPGWTQKPITLEIMNNASLKVALTPILDQPCQLSFFKLTSPLPRELGYESRPTRRFKTQSHPIMQGS